MDREAENKISLLMECGCKAELNSMWDRLADEIKDRADVLRAYQQRRADLLRKQRDAA